MARLVSIGDEALIALETIAGRAAGIFAPNVRVGVTGLSRAGKTVFITALVHNLLHGGRLPLFDLVHSSRLSSAALEPQPDDGVPRFAYESHVRDLVEKRVWPESTRAISELRLTVEYESASGWNRLLSGGRLHIDIVDYPGEWLLDLPLLGQSFDEFSAKAVALAQAGSRAALAAQFLTLAREADPEAPADEKFAAELSDAYKKYLQAGRDDGLALSTLPPGRFLMPGDLDGSPALTFAPLVQRASRARSGSLQAMMERRFESYKALVVKPFFKEHITRLDRQIVLIDAMHAMNAGPEAVHDLERALGDILACFRPGAGNVITGLWQRTIDRLLIAATKADHLHHEDHARMEAIVRRLVRGAVQKAGSAGASVETMAIAAVRATREATVMDNGERLPVIVGTPVAGEKIGEATFDGESETAIFPGDLPRDPDSIFKPGTIPTDEANRFVRFRPPRLEKSAKGVQLSLPHIRLDKALQFLLGDRLT
ncbi:YcjX family protein [Oricola cellulosilytica]|uniref:YcjX family protein n=1 Tax=Oricola cellulosilytica TaxID=1429082 RepID=A0A4R0P4F2_9HYPH|nr:YcjX family protein [Oricola cellulosilytica]TCD11783.1 YcjX family protein [Oricola cellulosilytica]